MEVAVKEVGGATVVEERAVEARVVRRQRRLRQRWRRN